MIVRPHWTVLLRWILNCLIANLLAWVIVVAPIADESEESIVIIAGGVTGFIWLIVFVPLILHLLSISYHIEDGGLMVRSGILFRRQQNIPYAKITDFVLVRSPVDRLLGLGKICVQTAGQSTFGYEAKLIGLTDYQGMLARLRGKITEGNPQPGATTQELLSGILAELKSLREALEDEAV